jgi:hypothetical protein
MTARPRRAAAAAALAAAAVLAAAAPAAGHGGGHVRAAAAGAAPAVSLRDCFMTVGLVPRPADRLRAAIPAPPDLTRTFYGSDPLVSLWGLSCARASVDGVRTGRLVLSLVAVPTGLTDPEAVPLANNFDHRLVRLDTSSRTLGLALRRRGLPAQLAPRARGRRGRVVVPGQYELRAAAVQLDQPHDHRNRFEHRPPGGGARPHLELETEGAVDHFCFPAAGGCSATITTAPRSTTRRVLGGAEPTVKAAFDHRRIARLDLPLRTRRTGG